VVIAILAVLSGVNGWNDIEEYGESKQAWLKGFLKLPNGIPSHDTFNIAPVSSSRRDGVSRSKTKLMGSFSGFSYTVTVTQLK
jgi:hypothetical protein